MSKKGGETRANPISSRMDKRTFRQDRKEER
jgi:hypothetical protein